MLKELVMQLCWKNEEQQMVGTQWKATAKLLVLKDQHQ